MSRGKGYVLSQKILVVDDSRSIRTLVSRKLESELNIKVDTAEDLRSTKALLENNVNDYLMAVVDLNLPDAPDGEVVDYVSSKGISSVVLTGTFDERIRKKLFSKNIIDYVLKEGGQDLDTIVRTVARLKTNESIKVLVVDDSRFSRNYIAKLLNRQHFEVLEAENGIAACEIMEANPDVSLVLADYHMPLMDGFELTTRLRKKFGKDSLAIIGISAAEDDYFTAKFIKLGANDFLKKPFGTEEFYCRVDQNLELLEMIAKIKEASNTDFLTRLFNRRYFFENGSRIYERASRGNNNIALAMIDIDHFKMVNDSYGHDGGDVALIKVSKILKEFVRPCDIVSRFGGEEFCVLLDGIDPDVAVRKCEELRSNIEATVFAIRNVSFSCTVSIGLTCNHHESLTQMIKEADTRLYEAKNSGRNRVIYHN